MIPIVKHSIRFLLFVLIQCLFFNQLEIGWGIQFMVYPLFIFLLPWDMNIFASMLVSFLMGLTIDSISNTYGLHASSAVVVAFLRPYFFKLFEPRDGYEINHEMNYHNMDFNWILSVQGSLLAIHHLWFFTLEIFKFNEILYVLQKSILSFPASFILCVLIQLVFIKKTHIR